MYRFVYFININMNIMIITVPISILYNLFVWNVFNILYIKNVNYVYDPS
jgi:hypothetical protein